MAGKDTRRYSLNDLERMTGDGDYVPTRADAPKVELDEAFWKDSRVVMPVAKASVHLRVDADVLEWFRQQGRGHLTRMNAVLRAYMDAHKSPPR